MNEVNYRYEFDQNLIAIEPLPGYHSVIVNLDQILLQVETQVGSLGGRHILCQGQDGYWDLLVPVEEGKANIFPLSAVTLAEAKVKLSQYLAKAGSGNNLLT